MLHAFIDLIFPRICVGCELPLELNENQICTDCRFELPKTNSHILPDQQLINKFAGRVNLKYSLSYLKFIKGGKVQNMMHALKYKGNQEIGEMLGRWYGADLKENGFSGEFDLVLPVPLHKNRLLIRGYNQSDSFAKGLAESLGIEWRSDILKRGVETETQIKKSRIERFQNMQDVFFVEKLEGLNIRKIVVVDDTLTTGATLESCVMALNEVGVKDISIMAIATAL
ncbi:ComF family protein [Arcicella aurantiaca]|uniref:ComF family protein n=1 Tax=Arcicella aurantiaca TaxID=591202 RepID=A0A316DJM9_9BACT|nr:ComF family protein [Arcicella aurantiaca]PWK17838.1 ComF family protein [Arcicella aurantiaca]